MVKTRSNSKANYITRFTSPKRMLSIWWSVKGVIWELLPEKTTVNAYRYRVQLSKLDAELINNGFFSGKIYFQHDNAKPRVVKFLWKKQSNHMRGRKFKDGDDRKRTFSFRTFSIQSPAVFLLCLDVGKRSYLPMGNI